VLSFLRRPKWIILGLVIAVFTVTFISLGFWQLRRLDGVRAENLRILETRQHSVAPAESLLSPDRPPSADIEYRGVTATGHWDTAHEIVVRGRAVTDRDGGFVITPLVTERGSVLLVALGWVRPGRSATAEPPVPPVSTGNVTVVGRIRRPETGDPHAATVGRFLSVTRIDPVALGRYVGAPTYDAYAELISQTPPGAGQQPILIPQGQLPEGNHESYAYQWFLFAIMAVGGYFLMIYLEVRRRRRVPGAVSAPEPASMA
jgi:cytochrome oxidase assembly protein ShyY1